jgi:hypothetical protein
MIQNGKPRKVTAIADITEYKKMQSILLSKGNEKVSTEKIGALSN